MLELVAVLPPVNLTFHGLQLILTIWERQGDTGPKPPLLAYPTRRSPAFVPVQLQVLISGPRRVRTLLP